MPFIQGDVAVQEIDQDSWLLLSPVVYEGRAERFEVPVNFATDFASVPKAFTWLIPRYGVYTKAAILHDFLCQTKPINRSDADGIFRRAMRELGVSFLRRWMMWTAVRIGCHLEAAKPAEVFQVLLVAIPTVAFLLIPYLVVVIWSAVFWFIEGIVYLFLKPVSKKQVNPPKAVGISSDGE